MCEGAFRGIVRTVYEKQYSLKKKKEYGTNWDSSPTLNWLLRHLVLLNYAKCRFKMFIVKRYWARNPPPKINDMKAFIFSGKPTTIKQWNCEFYWTSWWWFWHNEPSSLTEMMPVIVMEDNVLHLGPHLVTNETSCHPVLVIWIMPFLWNIEFILINISECTITKSKHNSIWCFLHHNANSISFKVKCSSLMNTVIGPII